MNTKAECEKSFQQDGPRVVHVLNSLGQIELWIAAIRTALSGLPADQLLPMSMKARAQFVNNSANRILECCPPPNGEPEA